MRVTHEPYAVEGWGVGELWIGDGRVVLAHEAPNPGAAPALTTPKGTPGAPTDTLTGEASPAGAGFVPDLIQRLHSFFRGERVSFGDVPLDLDELTPFQRAVSDALRGVPWGEVVSYGELAERAGYPRAGRAAGSFCAHNRFFLFVPCHRVVASDGIGSYGASGVEFKRRLLALEGRQG